MYASQRTESLSGSPENLQPNPTRHQRPGPYPVNEQDVKETEYQATSEDKTMVRPRVTCI